MGKSSKKRLAVERAVILEFMDEDRYWELYKEYGHEVVWDAFSSGVKTLSQRGARFRLFMFIRRWRMRVQRLQHWLESGIKDANQA